MKLLNTLPAILPLVLAAPAPPTETSPQFKLKSHVLSPPNPAFENLYLHTYHISPAYNYAVLAAESTRAPGIIGHLNGTTQRGLAKDERDLIFDFSGPELPYGFIIDQVNATYNPILINAGNGTKGIFIGQGVIKYHDPMFGGFYACNNTLPYGRAGVLQVFYKPKVITAPAECSDVQLAVEYV